MTLQCRFVLSGLKKLTHDTDCDISYLGNTTCFCLDDYNVTYDYAKYKYEIDSIIAALADEGYLEYTSNKYNFRLTQKGIHKTQITLSRLYAYLRDKFIDILALIVAIIALLKSYGYDVLTPVLTLCKTLLGR